VRETILREEGARSPDAFLGLRGLYSRATPEGARLVVEKWGIAGHGECYEFVNFLFVYGAASRLATKI